MARYQKYAEYKDSGVEWLGRVPSIWKIGALRWKISIASGEGISSIEMSKEQESSNSVPIIGGNGVMGFSNKINSLHAIAIGRVGALCGNVHLINYHSWISDNALKITRWSDFIDSFLVYLLKSAKLNDLASKTAQPLITGEQIKSLIVAIPSIEEQIKIANFLDHETAKIDTLIAKQEKLIELLKEKRQAVISHAVTKGLNPNVPMKDSGVEWLGEVPEHWAVTKVGFHTLKIGSGKTPKGGAEIYQDEGVLFIRSQNVYNDGLRVDSSESTYISEAIHDDMSTSKVYSGDILLNITGGSIGRSSLVPDEFPEANVNQHVCIIRVRRYLQEFLALVIQSDLIQAQLRSIQTGGNREGLNFEQISKFWFVLPPNDEQEQIISFIQNKLNEFGELEARANKAIHLMQERRTAIISAAVTGKIDVRHHASRPTGNDNHQTEVI